MRLRLDQPNAARMYNYFLGGKDNYEADREAADAVLDVFPSARLSARQNRAFVQRAVGYLAQHGVDQFLDIGTGLPADVNLHEIAQAHAPHARVVYVDNDPLVLSHARALLAGTPPGRTACVEADLNDPASILTAKHLLDTLDFTRPVALALFDVLHFIPDDHDPHRIVRTLLDELAPGSYLVMSHATADFEPGAEHAGKIYRDHGIRVQLRTRDRIAELFTGLELIEPGVTVPHRWRPHGIEAPTSFDAGVSLYAAMGRSAGSPSPR